MARPLRIQFPGAFYHITSRGNEKKAVFKNNKDREQFLSYIQSAYERYGSIIHVYCLMDNHYHLLIETPQANLSQILHHINGAYTTYFNTSHQRSGHLFQGRYKAILVEKDEYCQELSRYIHLNPVRAGLVERPVDYQWSSYLSYIGNRKKPAWLSTDFILDYFGLKGSSAQKQYQHFVESLSVTNIKDPNKEITASSFLGSGEFITWVQKNFINGKENDRRNIPAIKQLTPKRSLEDIERLIDSVLNTEDPFYKKMCMYTGQYYAGLSLKEIGIYYNMKESAVSQSNRRLKGKLLQDKKLKRATEKIVEALMC